MWAVSSADYWAVLMAVRSAAMRAACWVVWLVESMVDTKAGCSAVCWVALMVDSSEKQRAGPWAGQSVDLRACSTVDNLVVCLVAWTVVYSGGKMVVC